jgi:hypothetical protein
VLILEQIPAENGMALGSHSLRAGWALLALLATQANAGQLPLAGCYERVYDAAYLKAHQGQIVRRVRLAVGALSDPAMVKPLVAEAPLTFWIAGMKPSFSTSGLCRKSGQGYSCAGSLSATEADACPNKADGVRDCRIEWPDAAGSFRIEPRPDGVLVSIPGRLEVPGPDANDGLPFLYLSASNAENHAFRLTSVPASRCK